MRACLVWLPVLACGSAQPATPKQDPANVSVPVPSALIEVKELTIRFEGNPIARLHSDGRTESVGDGAPGPDAKLLPGPTLHADGTIDLTTPGFNARLESDGDIFFLQTGSPAKLFGRLTGEQILFEIANSRDSGVRLEDANLVLFHDSEPTNWIGVVDPPSMGRTALVMSAAFLMDSAFRRSR